jgi:hypothetical protein
MSVKRGAKSLVIRVDKVPGQVYKPSQDISENFRI